MKKVILLFVAVVSFALISNNLSAQTKTASEKAVVKTEQKASTPSTFVDKNKNGVCDKHEVKGGKANCEMNKGKGSASCSGKCKGESKSCGTEKTAAKACGENKSAGCAKSCKH
ncbi:MAG: hypothetical protein ACOYOV_11565 [Bacteroidales bacterium]